MINNNIFEEVPVNRRMTCRIPIIVAVLVVAFIALTMSPNSNKSSNIPSRAYFKTGNRTREQAAVTRLLHNECSRVRRDWYDLTPEERQLYFDAYWEMYRRGYVALFYRSHKAKGIHLDPDFLAWHRYFIFEFESRIRAMGGRFRCFALPYWDWSRMSGKFIAQNPLWKEGFGGNGVMSEADKEYFNRTGKYPTHSSDKVHGGCVLDGEFGNSTGYRTTVGDCLRRRFHKGNWWYQSTEQTLKLISKVQPYFGFEFHFELWHNGAHNGIGGVLKHTPTSPQDPMFFLLHSYVDFVWAMRSDCHGYDQMTNWRTNNQIFMVSALDSPLSYPFIDQHPWAISYYESITPAKVMNFTQFGIIYDFSDMVYRTGMQLKNCRFTLFNPNIRKFPPGHVRVPDSVLAKRGCNKAFASCKYKASRRRCVERETEVTLDKILNRTAPAKNTCVKRWRQSLFHLMMKKGNLLQLCNGKYDPVCASA